MAAPIPLEAPVTIAIFPSRYLAADADMCAISLGGQSGRDDDWKSHSDKLMGVLVRKV
jgi:hypothetical protein